MPPSPNPKPETRHPRLILASQSPRRAQLLRDAGFTFTQQSPPFADPDQPPEVVPKVAPGKGQDERDSALSPAERFAADLAMQKAVSMAQVVEDHALILAADTICVAMSPGQEGKLIGKPRDRADADAMLRGFMNGAHAVVSGVALLEVDGHQRAATVREPTHNVDQADPVGPLPRGRGSLFTSLADTAVVTLGHLDDAALDRYLDSGDWRGKAGGYNLFDRQTAGWPITVEGDPTTVVGLPMKKLLPALAAADITTPTQPSPPRRRM